MKTSVLLVVLLGAAAILAGCVQPAPAAKTSAVPDAPASLATVATTGVLHGAFAALPPAGVTMPVALGGAFHVGGSTGEPTLGVDKQGNIYVAGMEPAPNGVDALPDGGGTVFMSSDKGQTWKDVGSRLPGGAAPTHTVSLDPYLYVDLDTGRVFHDDIWPLGCGMLSYSDDHAKTWTDNPASCGNPQVNDHQTLVAAKPRMLPVSPLYPKVVYRCVNNVGDSACATSLDGGLTFGPQVMAMPGVEDGGGDTPQPRECGGLTGHLAAGPDGTVYLPRGGCGWAEVAVTQDDGLTWTTYKVDPANKTDDHEVRLAVDEANTVYATWMSQGQVLFAYSKDHGAKWSPAMNVTAPGVTAAGFNAVAAGAPGHVAIAYLGSTVPGGYAGKKSADDWKNATWNAYLTVMTNATTEQPVMQSVTANDPSDPLARGQCGRTRCNGMYDFIDVVIDAEGRPWASFQDVCLKTCAKDPTAKDDGAEGLVATLLSGPALRGANLTLPVIQPQVSHKPAAEAPGTLVPLVAPARD